MSIKKFVYPIVALLAIAFPYITPDPDFWVSSGGTRAIWLGVAALSMVFMNRNLGLMSLGQLFFSGIAGYTVAICTVTYGIPLETSIPLGIFLGTLAGVIIGFIAIRTKGVYFFMLTLAVTLGLYSFANQAQEFTRGQTGINSIPSPVIFGVDFAEVYPQYYLFLGIAIVLFAICKFLERTSFGIALQGVRDNEERMISMGYRTTLLKLLAFIFSSFIASIAGVMGVFYVTNISPTSVGLVRAIDLLVVVVIGGATYLGGAFIGAVLIAVFEAAIQDFTPYYVGATGILFIAVLMLAPNGLMGVSAQIKARRNKKKERSSTLK
jgi:branched-chain amino acid transport system permease protein